MMRGVRLAQGRLKTSRLGFGTSSLHHLKTSRARGSLLAHCYELGVRYFDSAPLYGHELAERDLGRFGRGCRSQIVIATKFGIEPHRCMRRSAALMYCGLALRTLGSRVGLPVAADRPRDYSSARMLRSLERSLTNLRTDHVDIFLAHEPALSSPGFSEELVRDLERIRAAGKARFLGLSGGDADCLDLARRYPQIIDVLQIDIGSKGEAIERPKCSAYAPIVTFGHFRAALQASAREERSMFVRRCLERASIENPQGVILFSARSTGRIDEVDAVLGQVDARAGSPGN